MATMTTTARSEHAELRRADIAPDQRRAKSNAFDPWNRTGDLAHIKGRGHAPTLSRGERIEAAGHRVLAVTLAPLAVVIVVALAMGWL